MAHKLEKLLGRKGVLLADGATGSNLFSVGLLTGDSPELWNDIYPQRIAAQYQTFLDAGSDIILTNTFGGTRYRLALHDAAKRVHELNVKGARIAVQQVESAGREVVIGGSMGPTGEILEPLGSLTAAAAADAFEEQALALQEGGVDVLWIETMSSREEVLAAIAGATRAGLPVVATFSVDTNGRTMMGLAPADIVDLSLSIRDVPFAIGANCGVGASELVAAVMNMQHALRKHDRDMIIIAKANCGVPQYIDGDIVYSGTTEIMADYMRLAVNAGARIIGGCCGTTPAHISAMREALDTHTPGDAPDLAAIESRLGAVSAGARAQLAGDLSIAAGALRQPRVRNARRRRRAPE